MGEETVTAMVDGDLDFDLAVIGSGAAAFAASITAVGLDRSVVMIERGTVGGTCVNVGCVPSKALLAAAETRRGAAVADRFPGLASAGLRVDFPALIGGKDALVGQLRSEKYADLAADYGWPILAGTAAFAEGGDGPVLDVLLNEGGTRRITAGRYLIAAGSAPVAPQVSGLSEAGYLTSTTAMEIDVLPGSMIVAGGGAVGLELAQLFARLGTDVTVVEALDRLAPFEEPEISAAVREVFTGEGIAVHTCATLSAVRAQDGRRVATVRAKDGKETELSAEQILVATGRCPVTGGLRLEKVGVKTGTLGEIIADARQMTTNDRIWAAGDVTGGPQFVYVAAAQGALAAENALSGGDRTLDYAALPRVTFTSPAIASVGMTDHEAIASGLRCDCRTLPLSYVPRAIVNLDLRGLIKIVAEAGTGRLLGVHAFADGAGDLITAAGYAIAAGWSVAQLASAWAPYLTMAEGLRLAAQAYTRDVSKLSCCA